MRGGGNMWEMERRYSVAEGVDIPPPPSVGMLPSQSEDLHAWSIYRQNLNSDFTDSALGSSEKSPLPYGNFQLRESTVQSILSHPRYGPKSPLGGNMYTYLKFGLPRVFPPNGASSSSVRGPRDNSSGYDSSDDGASPRKRNQQHGYYLRAASHPDFRNTPYHGPSLGPPAVGGLRAARGKSISEANLMSSEALMRQRPAPPLHYRRSVDDVRLANDIHHHHHPTLVHHHGHGRPASVAVTSNLSVLEPPHSEFTIAPNHATFNMPCTHLQMRGIDIAGPKGELLLQGVSLEVHAGEIFAIMATTATEGKALLETLSGRRRARGGHFILNGQNINEQTLRNRVSYVDSTTHLEPNLTTAQTIRFYARLRRPPKNTTSKMSSQEQLGVLLEDLGLAQVMNTRVDSLTECEKQRLVLACHLVAQTSILLLDRVTNSMDIFDTFFLIEFLRQYARGAPGGSQGRIVVLTLQPPTYEIFTMVSRVALISGNRLMYCGRRRDMLAYFTAAGYPCPAFKNPSDYYIDLVTLDDLSTEAMLESSQRIEQLSELYRRRPEVLSDPGPLIALPQKIVRANVIQQAAALLMCEIVYSQPSSLLQCLRRIILASCLSLIIGTIYWDIPASDPQFLLADRLGYHYTMMCVASWPLLVLVALSHCHGPHRDAVESDLGSNLYSRTLFSILTMVVSLLPSVLVWLAYLIPAYAMTGLYSQGAQSDSFYIYIIYMVVLLLSLQSLITFLGHCCSNRLSAGLLSALVITLFSLSSGFTIRLTGDRWEWLSEYVGIASPVRWTLLGLTAHEYSEEAIQATLSRHACKSKQVQRQDIIVQAACPAPNGTAALAYHGLTGSPLSLGWPPLWSPLAFYAAATLLSLLAFVTIGRQCRKHNRT